MKLSSLHDLAFGSAIARTELSSNALQERMAAAQGWESHYDVVGRPSLFATKTASLELQGLRLTAVSHSPFRSKVVVKNSSTLVVPLAGEGSVSQINGRSISMAPGVSAAFAPPGERIGVGGYRSVLMVDFDPARLQTTWDTMQGHETPGRRQLDLGTPHQLSLSAYGTTFQHLCGIVDQFCTSPQILVNLGLDESFYRTVALQMKPTGMGPDAESNKVDPATSKRLDAACQYVMAHLSETITLTDLERAANLSSRSLQYAFLKKFDCTPMQWVRNQRFTAVQRCLAAAGPDASVSSIALAFGFLSPSKFAAAYASRFGELPSQTLSQSPHR